MPDSVPSNAEREAAELRAEIARLNKVVRALIDRAERSSALEHSDFDMFQATIVLEQQVRQRTQELEAALRTNERINYDLEHAKARMEQEILERARSEEALLQSEERYRAATQAAYDAVITFDESNVITLVNASAERILGYSTADLAGRELRILMAEEDGFQRIREYLGSSRQQTNDDNLRLICRHKDGRRIPMEFSFGEYREHDKRFFTGIARDVSERERNEVLREAQVNVLEMIAMDSPIDDVLLNLLRAVEGQSDGAQCSVLLLEGGSSRTYRYVAPSLPRAFLDSLRAMAPTRPLRIDEIPPPNRVPVVVADLRKDRAWRRHRDLADSFGLRACWSTPILSGKGDLLGAFAMYRADLTSPVKSDIQLIELAARMAGIAIERRLIEDRVLHMATHDGLTGLPNRVLLQDRLHQAVAHAKRQQCLAAVLVLDLDHFKEVNDTLGHQAGDRILNAVASRICRCLREEDIVARLGGDEFVVGLTGLSDSQDAAKVAQKLHRSLARPFTLDHHKLRIGCSIGVSIYPSDATNPETLIRAADAAMYEVKHLEPGRYRFFQS